MQLRFYKDEEGWFVDLPSWEGSKEDLQMVCGADTFIDKLAAEEEFYMGIDKHGLPIPKSKFIHRDKLILEIQLEPEVAYEVLQKVKTGEIGAWYTCLTNGHLLWLCPVTEFVFGCYPDYLYFKK